MLNVSRTTRAGASRRRTASVLTVGAIAATVLPALATTSTAVAAPAPATAATAAPTEIWSAVAGKVPTALRGESRRVNPSEYAAYSLDATALTSVLGRAPSETAGKAGTILSVPAPTGELVEFRIVDSPVMESKLAAAHPEIRTYAGRAVGASAATIRLDVTRTGFHASVRGDGASWFVDPAFNGPADAGTTYLSYKGVDLPDDEQPLVEPESMNKAVAPDLPRAGEPTQGDAVIHRTYRLALMTDPSYARYFGTENVLSEKVTLMNRVNQIYNDDLAIKLVLIDGTDALNFDTDAKTYGVNGPCGSAACYTTTQIANGCGSQLLSRNRIVLGQLVGASSYDIGHVMLGINGGGIAGLGVVGGNSKASGCTGLPQPEGDFMAIDYVAHEMGHQFGGNHTFNGTQYNCGGNKAAPSVEPGSGTSVMAYAGICQQDNTQPHTDPYFSQWSQQEMSAYVTSIRAAINEVQTVSLRGFDTDGDSFTLSYGGQTTAPIVRGVDYTTTGIKAALEAILPTGGLVTVAAFGGSGTLADTGFQLTFNTPNGSPAPSPLAGVNIDSVGVAGVTGDVTGFVGETAKGGLIDNAGNVVTTTTNHTPIATAPATASIPLRTPFELTGSATDPDNDDMIYLWEQSDRGAGTGTALVSQTKTNGPLFRVFGTYANVTPAATLLIESPGENLADDNPTRTFPDIDQILTGNTNAETGLCPEAPAAPATGGATNVPVKTIDCFSEWLPTIDYVGSTQANNMEPSLNFRFTARDLDPAAGGYSFANTKVLIDPTAGPFLVSSKNVAAAAVAGRSELVTWAVAGTNKPTLAENVKISLSTDGGHTFPITLAESTPNDGTEPVVWPNVATDHARIKVEAVGNVFFDVNNADFEIVPKLLVTGPTAASYDVQYSDAPVEEIVVTAESGAVEASALTATATGLPDGLTLVKGDASADGVLPGTATFTVTGTADAAVGTYPVTVIVSDGALPSVTKSFDVVVTSEDATVGYTGPATATAGAGDEVEVSALVAETDASPGDLSTATVTFTDSISGATLCADAPVSATGVSTCSFAAQDGDYSIDLTVGGNYSGSSTAPGLLTVTIDETAPDTTIVTSPKDGGLLLSSATEIVLASEPGATFACTLDGIAVDCASGTATLTGLTTTTHVFEAVATDTSGLTDATPARITFTVPVDDPSLKRAGGGWQRLTSPFAYAGTVTKVAKKGAKLTYPVTDATALYLVVAKRSDYGTVTVSLNGMVLRTISLKAATPGAQKYVKIADLDLPTSGKVTITTTNAKQVRIDGLGVVTTPVPLG